MAMIILRQESHQFERAKQVVSHTINHQRKYSFLVEWHDERLSASWEPQYNCEPIKSLIRAYFQYNKILPHIKFREDCWDESKKILIPATKSKNEHAESIESLKLKQLQMGVSVLKDKEKRKIINYIRELDLRIRHGSPLQRRDYQIDYVQGVFKNKMGKTSFVIRTLQYSKFFVVSLQNMKQYFPKSLKRYFINLLELNTINQSYQPELQQNINFSETQKDQVPTRQSNGQSLFDMAISEREQISDLSSSSDL